MNESGYSDSIETRAWNIHFMSKTEHPLLADSDYVKPNQSQESFKYLYEYAYINEAWEKYSDTSSSEDVRDTVINIKLWDAETKISSSAGGNDKFNNIAHFRFDFVIHSDGKSYTTTVYHDMSNATVVRSMNV